MNDWTDGYVSDIEYTAGFYRELAPCFLNTCALIHGYMPPDATDYNYLELGCGRGMSSLILAAANPSGNFYAVDFNPAHIHEAKRLVQEAGLTNIEFIEASFEEIAEGKVDLPECQYIVFHGIYTWVNEENRGYLRSIVRHYLDSGGLVFNSYNSMPGWAPASPLQRLLRDWSRQHRGKSQDRLKKAVESIKTFAENNPKFLQNNPGVKQRLDKIVEQNPNYLVHEYLHDSWTVHWAGDVINEMQAEAKLDFIGQANPAEAYPRFVLPDAVRQQVQEISDPSFQEELKDTWLNRQFRKDIYCRGALKVQGRQQIDLLLDTSVVSTLENMENLDFNFQLPIGQVNPNKELYQQFLNLVDKAPRTIKEIREQMGIAPVQTIQLAMVLISVGWVHPVLPDNDPEPGKKLNQILAKQSHYSNQYNFMAAPVIGSAKRAALTDFLILDAYMNGHAQQMSDFVWQSLSSRNLKLKKDDTTLQTQQENISQLQQDVVPRWEEKTLPVWKAMGVV
jgi:ubiquinone/menaquinone biosynthesis C-methylase UbiE